VSIHRPCYNLSYTLGRHVHTLRITRFRWIKGLIVFHLDSSFFLCFALETVIVIIISLLYIIALSMPRMNHSTITITWPIVPLTFPHDQTFGNPLDHAKPLAASALPSAMWPAFPLTVTTIQRFMTFVLSKPKLMWTSLVVAKST